MIRVKEPKFGKLQMVCVEALGDGNQVWPFGSSANGCGEAGSDLHRHAGICKGEQDF